MKLLKNQKGFTLIELLISLALLGALSAGTAQVVHLAMQAREISDKKLDTYQRLRFIGDQLNSKIRSTHPLYIKQNTKNDLEGVNPQQNQQRMLAFEGKPTSIRFITFGEKLNSLENSPWIHEVHIYLDDDNETDKQSLMMMERDISRQEDILKPGSQSEDKGRVLKIADDVEYLKFRYYKINNQKQDGETSDQDSIVEDNVGEWVDSMVAEPVGLNNPEARSSFGSESNAVSLPRAIEVSMGLIEPGSESLQEESRLVELPPVIIPVYTGMVFERAVEENPEDNEKS